jgi:hypothetical protein
MHILIHARNNSLYFIYFIYFICFSIHNAGIPIDIQSLSLKGIRLDDGRTVGDYGIIKGTTLDLNTGASFLQIFLKTPEGKKVPMEVNPGDSVKMLKQQIEGKESMRGCRVCECAC